MKTIFTAAAFAVLGAVPTFAQDYNVTVTNLMPEGKIIAPIIVLDDALSQPFLFNEGGGLSEDFVTTILEGDPRPMNGKIGAGVAGPVLGKSGPPGVLINGGETATTDLYLLSNTLRFYAKAGYAPGSDYVISGVFDIAMGGGTVFLNRYDIGHNEGTNEVTLVEEAVVKVVITPN